MDPDEASFDAADVQAGGDNLLNPVTTATTSHPPTTLTNSATDKNSTPPNNEPDSPETVNANNLDVTKETSLGQGLVETGPPDDGSLETEKVGQAVEGLGPREEFETGGDDAAAAEVPPVDDSRGIDEAKEMGGVYDGEVAEERRAGGEGGGPKQEEEEWRDEDGGHHLPGEDGTKESSGQDNPTEDPIISLKRRQRASLYREGLKLQETAGNTDEALRCYLEAITGLTEMEAFTELPQCLHQIADIYFEKKEYEKAVHFIQAEKMYYETALIDIVNLQKQLESNREEDGDETTKEVWERIPPDGPDSPEIIKAKEYENLAKLCLKESKPHLALEYCGKATKVYRDVYGDNHPITVGSLDLFTVIYADVGKKLYADAMHKFDAEETNLEAAAEEQSQTESGDKVTTAGEETANELRQRSRIDTQQTVSQPSAEPNPQPRTEFEPAPQPEEKDDWVTTCLLMLLFFLITVLVLLIMSYFYCLGNERSSLCHQFKGDLSYWYMKIKHYYPGYSRR